MKGLLTPLAALWTAVGGFVRRKTRLCVGVLVGLAVVVGGVLGYGEYQRRTRSTLEFAVSQINQALLLKDMALLAEYVDLEAVATALLRNIEASPGLWPQQAAPNASTTSNTPTAPGARDAGKETPAKEGSAPKNAAKGRTERQQQLLAIIKEALKGGEIKDEPTKERSRFLKYLEYTGPVFEELKPPLVVPGNLLTQMTERPFTIQGRDGDVGVLATTIVHPVSKDPLHLRLLARKTPSAWKITEIANNAELVGLYKKALEDYANLRESVFHTVNARIREVMGAHCYVIQCSVVVDSVQRDGQVKVIVHLEGSNIGRNTLLTAGLRIKLFGPEGTELAEMPIGINNRIPVGSSFRQYYHLDLDLEPEVAARLKPLQQLKASWEVTSVSLDNRLFIFPKPLSELEGKPS